MEPRNVDNRRTHVVLSAALILMFAAGAFAFLRLMPPFENSDELAHVGYVLHLALKHELPRVTHPPRGVVDQEAIQPPLYYLSAMLFVGKAPKPARPLRDPAFQWSPAHPGAGPHRLFQPITNASSDALRAMAAACVRIRIASICWGLLAAVLAAPLLARFAKQDAAQAALALSIFLLNPRWMETAASAGNDVAATAAATAVLLLMTRFLQKADATPWDAALLGFASGLAVLNKLNNIGLILLGIPVILWHTRRRGAALALFLAAAVLPLAPWMIRNQLLYGNMLALGPELQRPFVAVRKAPLGLLDFFTREFQGFRWSYFAVFGQFAVLADPPVYWLLDAFLLVCGVAGTWALLRDIRAGTDPVERAISALLLLWILVLFGEFVIYNRSYLASQGRYLFPASTCIAHVLARGLLALFPKRAKTAVAIAGSTLLAAFAFYVILSVLPRAYPA